MSATRDKTVVEQALHMALQRRHPGVGLLHHTDRGSQYTSTAYRALLAERGITVSMSRKRDCWDNALMESVWATLKEECVKQQTFATHQQARTVIFDYLEVFYHRQRLHSSLGYLSPATFDLLMASSDSFPTP